MSSNYLISKDTPLRILFVEDNELNRFYIQKITEHLCDKIEMAENGKVAVSKASSTIYDFIFMDINLPKLNGYEATKAIKKLPDPYCGVKIIGMTNIEDSDIDYEKSTDIIDFIDKPFKIEELKSKINLFLQNNNEVTPIVSSNLLQSQDSPILKIKDPNVRNKMTQIYLSQQNEFIEKMDKNIGESHWENISDLIHKFKSSLEVMGFIWAGEKLSLMEENLKEKNQEAFFKNYQAVKQGLKDFSASGNFN